MKAIIIFFINLYRNLISPPLKMIFGGGCRFYPTCSNYAKQATERYGLIKGGGLALKRLVRCHPWTHYQLDFVPKT